MASLRSITAIALLFSLSSAAMGAPIEVQLPGLIRAYSPGSIPFSNFYLGFNLRDIQGASLQWTGSITPGLGQGDGILLPREQTFPWPAQLIGFMDGSEQGLWRAPVGPLSGGFVESTAFQAQGSPNWAFLFDGVGHVEAYLEPAVILGGVMVTAPQASVEAAVLVLEAETVTATQQLSWGATKSLFGAPGHETGTK